MSEEIKKEELDVNKEEAKNMNEKKKLAVKEKIVGMLNTLNDERAAVCETKAVLFKTSDKETRKALKKELREHKLAVAKIVAKLAAIPVGILVAVGLFGAVRAALKGNNKVIDVEAQEIVDDDDNSEDDCEDEDESVDETDDTPVEE